MRRPLVTIVDQALPLATFRTLSRAVNELGDERLVAGYQTTFWFPLGDRPTSRVEAVVERLSKHLPRHLRKGVTGVEWWLSRMRTSNVKVDFHRDRDNARFDSTAEEVHPRVSSLLYLNTCRGGLLAVCKEDPNPHNPAFVPDAPDFDFVAPRPNRFTFFEGTLTHGVLDANNEVPGRRIPREPALRLAIAVNFWAAPPWAVPRFATSRHYRALASGPRRGVPS